MERSTHYMRPSGRHILTIGRDLIQDPHAAIIELVKNSYDADATKVEISLKKVTKNEENESLIEIEIMDNGHGMSSSTIIDKWLVPSTEDKSLRKLSPKKRTLQGRKGIGRYSVSILGDQCLLESVDEEKKQTSIFLDWNNYKVAKFMDEVPVLLETKLTSQSSGTKILINGDSNFLNSWLPDEYENLITQLKKLKPPFEDDDFRIYLKCDTFFSKNPEYQDLEITPFKIFDYYDYRINGVVNTNGILEYEFHNQRIKGVKVEKNITKMEFPVICGEVKFDIRVFDREPEAIGQLISRGLTGAGGEPLGKLEARKLLDNFNGVAVYRNKFRIRPLGEPGFDWLKLDNRRVQMPSLRISSNQVIGFIEIQSEEYSNLEEKSARDGLKDNNYYRNFIDVVLKIIRELEPRRFEFRKSAGISRENGKIEDKLDDLYSMDKFKLKARKELEFSGVKSKSVDNIMKLIEEEQKEKIKLVEEIRYSVALYQGQATLGKIMNVVLHEGRRPLSFFKNQIRNMKYWGEELLKNFSQENHDLLLSRLDSIEENSKMLVKLFEKIDPLASGRKGKAKKFKILKSLNRSFEIFETDILTHGIRFVIDCKSDLEIFGWEEDFIVIFTNLIDNSIYWLNMSDKKDRIIDIKIEEIDNDITINFVDNGPGIPLNFIENKLIFEPEFSLKEDGGSGLGLAIAGEAAERNGFKIAAIEYEYGAYFLLTSNKEELL